MIFFNVKTLSFINFIKHLSQIFQKPNENTAFKLVYENYGRPENVLKLVEEAVPKPKNNEVLIKMLAAPVHPADINTIQGVYPTKPKLPAVPGFEGVGKIIEVGQDLKDKFQVDDHVIPILETLGTWRTHATFQGEHVLKVSRNLNIIQAATFMINPFTAYRMLKDFRDLTEGDVVIQNGSNSTVGQYVIQLAHIFGLRTINVIRNRPDIKKLKKTLERLGATIVLTEEEIKTTDIFRKGFPKPKLALNCVGGKSAEKIMKRLETGGLMVTYGGMSRQPIIIPVPGLIFKDIKLEGFWVTIWSKDNFKCPEWYRMIEELQNMAENKQLKVPEYQQISITDYKKALKDTLDIKGRKKKYIIVF